MKDEGRRRGGWHHVALRRVVARNYEHEDMMKMPFIASIKVAPLDQINCSTKL